MADNGNEAGPNVLVFLCDQLQAAAVNGSDCHTPNLDRFAKTGVRFTHAYTPSPTCSPARASLMTGRLPHNHGVWWVTHTVDSDTGRLREDAPHWAQRLQVAGYDTAYFGKWHVEHTDSPSRFGWDLDVSLKSRRFGETVEREGFAGVGESDLLEGVVVDQPEGYTRRLVGGAVEAPSEKRHLGLLSGLAQDYIKDKSDSHKPWCAVIATPEPHDPFICSQEFLSQYPSESIRTPPNWFDKLEDAPELYRLATSAFKNLSLEERQRIAAYYYALVTEIDSYFGTILQTLEETGQRDNTVIIFTSDHGELLGAHGLYFKNISGYEEAYGIPLIVSGPNIQDGAVSTARVGLHDLAQTILQLAGAELLPTNDSSGFAQLLMNTKGEANPTDDFRRGYAESFGGRLLLTQRILWDGKWKIVFNGYGKDELYDLDSDPYELRNLIEVPEYQTRVKEMMGELWSFANDTGDRTLFEADYPALRVAAYGPSSNDRGQTQVEVSHW